MLRTYVLLVLLPIFVVSLQYDIAIPNIRDPGLNSKAYEEVPENVTFPPGNPEMDENGELKFVTGPPRDFNDPNLKIPMWQTPLHSYRSYQWPLFHHGLEHVVKEYGLKWGEDLKKFNERGDWTLIKADDKMNVYKAFTYRRVVVEDTFLKHARKQHNMPVIDVFDDYQVVVPCLSPKTGHSFDQTYIFRNKLHYVKFSYVCKEKVPQNHCIMSTIYDAHDSRQGWINPQLSGMILRMVSGEPVYVNTWRQFWICETNGFRAQRYPTFAERLDSVGLTEFDVQFQENHKVMLALRLFGLELLRGFRRTIPGFTEDMIQDLEHQEHIAFKKDYLTPDPIPESHELEDDTIGK